MRKNLGWLQFREDVSECPRCGKDHKALLFRRIKKGAAFGIEITHTAKCPTNGDPITLMSRRSPLITVGTFSTAGCSGSTSVTAWIYP